MNTLPIHLEPDIVRIKCDAKGEKESGVKKDYHICIFLKRFKREQDTA